MENTIVLWGVKKGEPDYMEEIIKEYPANDPLVIGKVDIMASIARKNGYDRLRISTFNGEMPDFIGALNL